jgi:hypothetical protein
VRVEPCVCPTIHRPVYCSREEMRDTVYCRPTDADDCNISLNFDGDHTVDNRRFSRARGLLSLTLMVLVSGSQHSLRSYNNVVTADEKGVLRQ